jgi:uncharacterized protein
MAVNPLSPGVYIDEISVFPPSVAPVATAVPAFIGYTEKTTFNGNSLLNVPFRITTMLEYETVFGGAFDEEFDIGLTGINTSLAATSIAVTVTLANFTMHYNMQMYFANGGGPCYIVSVGDYAATMTHTALIAGVAATEKADEVTLLVVPETVALTNASQRAAIHSAQLDLCNKMKDRFALMDTLATVPAVVNSIGTDASLFRNSDVGLNNLKYGATYYPSLDTLLTRSYSDSGVDIVTDARPGSLFAGKKLSDILNGVAASANVTITYSSFAAGNSINIAGVVFTANATAVPNNQFLVGVDAIGASSSLISKVNAHPVASLLVSASIVGVPSAATAIIKIKSLVAGTSGNSIDFGAGSVGGGLTPTGPLSDLLGGINPDMLLYNAITAKLATYTMTLYPSSTMAGIYASVDRDRGVWKAPANVSLAGVVAPSVNISASEQDILNVDAGSGKSINAIRAFAGKGVLVWGARTLAGNDNEWRYINVRRLFIYAEESIMKATEFVVFEPNDRNTWSRVRSLINSFLTNLWRDGGLVGASTEEAFFVKVGLGETMTAQDILEGKMIIQIGLAASRPAEFIILQFSHKLQES